MFNNSRQELQDDIFRMYGAHIDSKEGKSKRAPMDIDHLKILLTGKNSLYKEIDFETELNYLIDSKYFERYAAHFIIPTVNGMNKIWGETTNSPSKDNVNFVETVKIGDSAEKKINRGSESWNFFWIIFSVTLGIVIFVISILPLDWMMKILIFIIVLIILSYFCFFNAWWQNKMIGLKNFLEDSWKKL